MALSIFEFPCCSKGQLFIQKTPLLEEEISLKLIEELLLRCNIVADHEQLHLIPWRLSCARGVPDIIYVTIVLHDVSLIVSTRIVVVLAVFEKASSILLRLEHSRRSRR